MVDFVVYIGSVLLLLVSTPVSGQQNQTLYCHKYSDLDLVTTKCTQTIRDNDRGDFQDLYVLLLDAKLNEGVEDFIVYAVTLMYRYVHCKSEAETLVTLFYNATAQDLTMLDQNYWSAVQTYLDKSTGKSGVPLVGRRRQLLHTTINQYDLTFIEKLRGIARDTLPACIQWLIHEFYAVAAVRYKQNHPAFPDFQNFATASPSTTATTSQSSSSSYTTTATGNNTSLTASAKPNSNGTTTSTPTATPSSNGTTTFTPTATPSSNGTTTSTPKATPTSNITITQTSVSTSSGNSITSSLSITSTAATTTTTSASATTYSNPSSAAGHGVSPTHPVSHSSGSAATAHTTPIPRLCTVCSGIDCLSVEHVTPCPTNQEFCLIVIKDNPNNNREIFRHCAEKARCDSIRKDAICRNVLDVFLPAGTTCEYCCNTDNCNAPPYLRPQSNTLYSSS